jgi:hypothetical protein
MNAFDTSCRLPNDPIIRFWIDGISMLTVMDIFLTLVMRVQVSLDPTAMPERTLFKTPRMVEVPSMPSKKNNNSTNSKRL